MWRIAFTETDSPTLVRGAGGKDIRSRGEIWVDTAHRSDPANRADQRRRRRPCDDRGPLRDPTGIHAAAAGRNARACTACASTNRASTAAPCTAVSASSRSPPARNPSRSDDSSRHQRRRGRDLAHLSCRGRRRRHLYVPPRHAEDRGRRLFHGTRHPVVGNRIGRARHRHVQAHPQPRRPRLARGQRVVHGRSRGARQRRWPR